MDEKRPGFWEPSELMARAELAAIVVIAFALGGLFGAACVCIGATN